MRTRAIPSCTIEPSGKRRHSILFLPFLSAASKSALFRVETEGHLLDGSEVKIYTDDDDIHQEFAHGQNDNIWSINELLSNKMLREDHPGIGEDEIEFNV